MLRVLTGLPGAQVSRVSPFACVYHFNSSSELRSGLSSPGMKCPRNQPRVCFEASMTFPETGVDVSDSMSFLLAICRQSFRTHPRWLRRASDVDGVGCSAWFGSVHRCRLVRLKLSK